MRKNAIVQLDEEEGRVFLVVDGREIEMSVFSMDRYCQLVFKKASKCDEGDPSVCCQCKGTGKNGCDWGCSVPCGACDGTGSHVDKQEAIRALFDEIDEEVLKVDYKDFFAAATKEKFIDVISTIQGAQRRNLNKLKEKWLK